MKDLRSPDRPKWNKRSFHSPPIHPFGSEDLETPWANGDVATAKISAAVSGGWTLRPGGRPCQSVNQARSFLLRVVRGLQNHAGSAKLSHCQTFFLF